MNPLRSAIDDACKDREHYQMLSPEGINIIGFYISEGEEVGAGEIVEDDRVDFKAFHCDSVGQVQTVHLGGMLVERLKCGRYSDAAGGIRFGGSYGLAADQVEPMVRWLERVERGTQPAPFVSEKRKRLSVLAT